MSSDNNKIKTSQEFPETITPKIAPYTPTCKFKKHKMSKTFEKALEAVDDMDKTTTH